MRFIILKEVCDAGMRLYPFFSFYVSTHHIDQVELANIHLFTILIQNNISPVSVLHFDRFQKFESHSQKSMPILMNSNDSGHWAGASVLNYLLHPAPDIDIELNNVILQPPLTIHHPQVENYTIWQSGLNAEITLVPQTKVCKDITITEISKLKDPSSAFTFKTLC